MKPTPTRPLAGLMAALCLSPAALAQEAPPPVAAAAEVVPAPGPQPLQPVAFGGDLVPLVGSSALERGGDLRSLSVGLVTWAGGIDGLELSLLGGLIQRDVNGLQATGGLNLVGGSLDGLQLSAGANAVGGFVDGVQLAAGGNLALGAVDGVQAAGGGNLALGDLDGIQAAGGVNAADNVDGLQLAPFNLARGRVEGLQLGVVNVARSSTASLGLVNFIWEGRSHIDGWVDESGFGTVALKHGSDRIHNYFGISLRPQGDCPEWALLYGLGLHHDLGRRLFMEVDGIVRHISPTAGLLLASNELYTLRAGLGLRLVDGLALTGGLSWNTYVSTWSAGGVYSPLAGPDLSAHPGLVVRQWPGFTLGVQLLPGRGDSLKRGGRGGDSVAL